MSLGNWWTLLENAVRPDPVALAQVESDFNQQGGRAASAAQHQLRLAAIEAHETGGDPTAAVNQTADDIRALVSQDVLWSESWNETVTTLKDDVLAESPEARVSNATLYEFSRDTQAISESPTTADGAERRLNALNAEFAEDVQAALQDEFDAAFATAGGATISEREAMARSQVLANHADDAPQVVMFLDGMVGEIIAQRNLLRVAETAERDVLENPRAEEVYPWVQRDLASSDPLSWAVFEQHGIQLTRGRLSAAEESIAETDPRLAGLLQGCGIEIRAEDGITIVRIGDVETEIDPRDRDRGTSQTLEINMSSGTVALTPEETEQIINGLIPDEGEDPDWVPLAASLINIRPPESEFANSLLLADRLRPEFTETRTDALWEDGDIEGAARVLNTNLNAALFDRGYFRGRLDDISQEHDSGDGPGYLSAVGDYLLEAGSYLPPEAADVLVNETHAALEDMPEQSNSTTMPGTLYAGLTQVVEVADRMPRGQGQRTRAEEIAEWLLAEREDPESSLREIIGPGISPAYEAFYLTGGMDGGALSLSNAVTDAFAERGSVPSNWSDDMQLIAEEAQRTTNRAVYQDFLENQDRYTANLFDQFLQGPNISDMREVEVGNELTNLVGRAMDIAPTNAGAATRGDNSVDWYEGSDQRETIDLVAGWILMRGGLDPAILEDADAGRRVKVAALPFLYVSERDGVRNGVLFRVQNAEGEESIVDASIAGQVIASDEDGRIQAGDDVNASWHYSSVNDFQDHNDHFAADGRIYLPKDLRIQDADDDGHVDLEDRDASVWTGWEKVRFVADTTSGVVAVAGGIMLSPFTGGGSLAGAVLFLSGTSWQIYSSAYDLQTMQSHGQSIGWGNGNARRAWMDIAGSASSMVTRGSAAVFRPWEGFSMSARAQSAWI